MLSLIVLSHKNERLQKVEIYICAIRDLSATLGTEASMIITKIHPSLNDLYGISKNISDDILKKLNGTVVSLEEEKHKCLEKVKLIRHVSIHCLAFLGGVLVNNSFKTQISKETHIYQRAKRLLSDLLRHFTNGSFTILVKLYRICGV